jgi:hypothetical protein
MFAMIILFHIKSYHVDTEAGNTSANEKYFPATPWRGFKLFPVIFPVIRESDHGVFLRIGKISSARGGKGFP